MIGHFHIQNFKCLRDVAIDFAPFTVLIGPNDSGKSSILQAIDELSMIFGGEKIELSDRYNERIWRRKSEENITWDVIESTSNNQFKMSIPGAKDGSVFKKRIQSILASYKKTGFISTYGFNEEARHFEFVLPKNIEALSEKILTNHPYKLQSESLRKMAPSEPEPSLDDDGSNLAAVLEAMLTGPDRASLYELEQKLYQSIPTLRGISVPTVVTRPGPKQRATRLKALQFVLAGQEHPPITIPAELVSDGALILTAYLALAYGDTPEILLIEEPENGLHPSRLKMIIDLLRKVTTGEVGNRKRQIIMTTHSPLLLNYCQPEEVRIVTRDGEGATQVTPLTAVPDVRRLLDEFAIGELWYLLGEEGLLRGETP